MGNEAEVVEDLMGELGISPEASKLEEAAVAPVEAPKPEPAPVAVGPAPALVVEAPKGPVLSAEQKRILDSREALKHPLAKGQKFFESPEGYIVVGEDSANDVWCRQANNGKGCKINPRR